MKLNNNLYRIITINEATASFELELLPDSLIYQAHFPGRPVTPGVCIIKIAGELLSELFDGSPELIQVGNAKFLNVIDPLETRQLTYTFKKITETDTEIKASVTVLNDVTTFARLSLTYKKQH